MSHLDQSLMAGMTDGGESDGVMFDSPTCRPSSGEPPSWASALAQQQAEQPSPAFSSMPLIPEVNLEPAAPSGIIGKTPERTAGHRFVSESPHVPPSHDGWMDAAEMAWRAGPGGNRRSRNGGQITQKRRVDQAARANGNKPNAPTFDLIDFNEEPDGMLHTLPEETNSDHESFRSPNVGHKNSKSQVIYFRLEAEKCFYFN